MDLPFEGKYRMVEISRMSVLWEIDDHVMLLPSIMEKLSQLQVKSHKPLLSV